MIRRIRACILGLVCIQNSRIQILQPFESRLHSTPLEGIVPNQRRPLVIVVARVDHVIAEVDGTGASQSFASGEVYLATIATLLWSGFITPVHNFIGESGPSLTMNAR